MRALVWSPAFTRAARRPDLRERLERALDQLTDDPFHASLRSHKLKGQLQGAWARSIDIDYRILFEFVSPIGSGEDDIFLLTIGTHDEVY